MFSRRTRWPPVAFAFALIVVAAAWSIRQEFVNQRARAAARLQTIAELRATQVQGWLDGHMALAYFLDDGTVFSDLWHRWRDLGDESAGKALLGRAIDARHVDGSDSALLVDADGNVLLREHPSSRTASAPLRAVVRQAIAAHQSMSSSIYRAPGTELPLRLDVVVPFLKTGDPARGAMVLRIDPRRSLFPLLAAWPEPTRTGDVVLWDRQGDRAVNISEIRHQPDSEGTISIPLAGASAPIARAVRGELRPGAVSEGDDYWGTRVLFVARPVGGTSWWLVSKIDLAEVDAPAWAHARASVAVALLGMVGVLLAWRVWTQRRNFEQALREREEQRERLQALALLEAVASSASEAIYAKDLQGRYIFCNRAASRAIGRPPREILGRTSEALFGAETAARMAETERRAMAGELDEILEETMPTSDGDAIFLTTKRPLVDAQGTLIGSLGVSRDVTDMRRAERALRESEEYYRTLVSVLDEGVMVCDLQGRFMSCNPAAERMLGVTSSEWEGQSFVAPGWSLVDDQGRPIAPEQLPIARVLAGGEAEHGAIVHSISPGGEATIYQISSVPLVDSDTRELAAVVTSFSNVTRQRQLEADLRRHRDELEALVEARTRELTLANASLAAAARFNRDITDALPGLLTYWDEELRCRFANRTWLEWFGKTEDEVLGRTRAEVFGEQHEAAVAGRLADALRGVPQLFELEPWRVDGERRFVQVHYQPARDLGGRVRGVYVLAFDITALKRAEAALTRTNEALARSRDEAESANRAKSAFVANMSHEIRTPLNGILGLAHLLARDPRDALQRDRLEKIGEAGHHLLQIINDILDLSKIEAGKLTLEEADFSLDALVSNACDMVDERARGKGLELILDTDHVPDRLRGDPTRLSQVILNLLSNAVKFTETGWVRLKGQLLDVEGDRVHLRFEVQDTGPGIDPARQADLFNAFEQGDNSTTRRFGGTGLGLSLTRKFAAAMGGEVGVSSVPGQGSTFWFTAWLGRSGVDGDPLAPIAMQSLRVLLVDDLPEASRVIQSYLEAMGMRVDTPSSGEMALQQVEAAMTSGRPYDLMLIDASMQGLDGIEMLARMRKLMGEGMPPCVLMSATSEDTLKEDAFGVRFDALLHKPVTASALHDVIVQVLYRQGGARREEPSPDAVEALVRERHAGQRVLLAEDNIINRLVAKELLAGVGLVVEQAEDGAIALDLALAQRYDLILMDMQMPVMDGLDAARAIRARGLAAVPVIAMTANAFAEDRESCLAAGMNDHVAKPVNPSALYAMLLKWLPRPGARAG